MRGILLNGIVESIPTIYKNIPKVKNLHFVTIVGRLITIYRLYNSISVYFYWVTSLLIIVNPKLNKCAECDRLYDSFANVRCPECGNQEDNLSYI